MVHIWCYTSSNLLILFPPSLPLYLLTTLYFTITPFSLSYILILLLPILFCINSISLLKFNPYFSNKKTLSALYLSLTQWIFVLSNNFDQGWWRFFFFNNFLILDPCDARYSLTKIIFFIFTKTHFFRQNCLKTNKISLYFKIIFVCKPFKIHILLS